MKKANQKIPLEKVFAHVLKIRKRTKKGDVMDLIKQDKKDKR